MPLATRGQQSSLGLVYGNKILSHHSIEISKSTDEYSMGRARLTTSIKRTLAIVALLSLVLFKFQNCAPAPGLNAASDDPLDGEVRIVDRWAPQKVSFVSSSVVVENANQPLYIQGLCVGSQKGQQISYQVIEVSEAPQVVHSGIVDCVMGGFELQVQALRFTTCSSRYQVRASRVGDDQNYAETILQPHCSG